MAKYGNGSYLELSRKNKTIKRRLMRGREAASKEGKWVSGSCPYDISG